MKVILFFCRVGFICNICFLLFAFFNWQEHQKGVQNNTGLVSVPFIKNIIITLGWPAIFLNLLINLMCLITFSLKRRLPIPVWLFVVNFIFLIVQVFYFYS